MAGRGQYKYIDLLLYSQQPTVKAALHLCLPGLLQRFIVVLQGKIALFEEQPPLLAPTGAFHTPQNPSNRQKKLEHIVWVKG